MTVLAHAMIAEWPVVGELDGRRTEERTVESDGAQADTRDVQCSRQGDEEAFRRIVVRHQPAIFRQMWRFSRDPGVQDELVQEVFVQAFLSLRGYRGDAPFEHWLRRIATRVGYRYWKHEVRDRRRREVLQQVPVVPASSVEDLSPSGAAEWLHEFLAQMNPKDRLILTLMYFEECDGAEIVARTGWNSVLVRVRAHRARQRLRQLLEQAGVGKESS